MSGPLLVRLRVGHCSQLIASNPNTYRYDIYVRTDDGEDYEDSDFIQKVRFTLQGHHLDENGADKENITIVNVERPPFMYTANSCEDFSVIISIFMDHNEYKIEYTMRIEELSCFVNEKIYVPQCSDGFYSIATRFGAKNVESLQVVDVDSPPASKRAKVQIAMSDPLPVAMSGPLLVRIRIGHNSQLISSNPPKYRYSIDVRTWDGANFEDSSFVQKTRFAIPLHHLDDKGDDKEYLRVCTVAKPPFLITDTSCTEEFTASLCFWLDGKQHKTNYYVNFNTGQSEQFKTETIYVSRGSNEFYSIARRFGADNVVRSNETEYLDLPGIVRSMSHGEKTSGNDGTSRADRDIFPFMELPSEIILKIFTHLSIHDRWQLRMNTRLLRLEKVDRPVIPVLTITSSVATPDGATLISPANPSLAYGRVGVDFVRRLERLALYNIETLRISFVCHSYDERFREPFNNFRRDCFRRIGMMTASAVYSDVSYFTMTDFGVVIFNKKNFFISREYKTMFSKGYSNVVKRMFKREIDCRRLETPLRKNEYMQIIGYLQDEIVKDSDMGIHVQRTPDGGIEIETGGFRLSLNREEFFLSVTIE